MVLDIKLQFIYAAHRRQMYLSEYTSSIQSGDRDGLFSLDDFDKTSYAQKVLNEEIEVALKRTNERLLADGFGEKGFQLPHIEADADGKAQ